MVRKVLWAFLFLVLVILTTLVYLSNETELSHKFALGIDVPFTGDQDAGVPQERYQTSIAPSVAAYFAICLLAGGFLVMILSLAVVFQAKRAVKQARQETEDLRFELNRLRGPAEDDEVYRAPASTDMPE